jgi:uncharacterized metal-binding protein YceD (DUF177 family)
MSETSELPIDWTIAVEALPEKGGAWSQTATDAERKAVADALDLVTLAALSFSGRIERKAGGRYRVTGHVKADLEQPCVVTLDPVAARIDELVDVEFRPEAMTAPEPHDRANPVDVVLDAGPDVEPIVRGRLEIGRVVFETLSAALDPYPRKAGEAIDEMVAAPKGAEPVGKVNPFAVLADFKAKKM